MVVGELVAAAAERHLRDLIDGGRRGLHWSPAKAKHAIEFYPSVLTVTAGMRAGKPFDLLDWMMFCAGSLFGWHMESGRLRFRHGWLETGKGQAKSPFMAATGLYMVGFRDVPRAEGYAIGWDRKTANVPFQDAVAMCRAPMPGQDDIEEGFRASLETLGQVIMRGTGENVWRLEFPATMSKFQALANGESVSGPRPCFVMGDEIHEFKANTSLEMWKAAIVKMAGDALMLMGTNTPATSQLVGTDYSDFYQKVAKGAIKDDEAFAFIARVDKKDKPFENEACWVKALPALGTTFPIENVRGLVASAKVKLSTKMTTNRLYFGVPTGSTEFWISEEAWASALGVVNPDEFKDCPCWLSLDLSQKNDLTALTAVWLKDGKLYAKTWYWTTQSGLEDRALREKAAYPEWIEIGALTAVPGPVIDKTFVAAQVAEIVAAHDVQFMAFDVAHIADFMDACTQIGFPVWRFLGSDKPDGTGLKLVAHAQGTRVRFEDKQLSMPRSVERLEDRILTGGIVIDASPVTYMCASNAKLIEDGQKNRAFDKVKSRGRIDGLVTIAMATGASAMEEKPTMDLSDFLANPVVA